jgi:hypothetical protein
MSIKPGWLLSSPPCTVPGGALRKMALANLILDQALLDQTWHGGMIAIGGYVNGEMPVISGGSHEYRYYWKPWSSGLRS